MKKIFFLIVLIFSPNIFCMQEQPQTRPLNELITILNQYIGFKKPIITLEKSNFASALNVALTCMNNEKAYESTIEKSLNLVKRLITENYVEAKKAGLDSAIKWVSDERNSIKQASLNIFLALVNSDYVDAYKHALKASTQIFMPQKKSILSKSKPEPDEFVKSQALKVISSLVNKKYSKAYPEALSVAELCINDEKILVKQEALDLFQNLVNQKYEKAYNSATKAAEENILIEAEREEKANTLYDETQMREDSCKIFEILINERNNDAFEAAVQVLKNDPENIKNPNSQEIFLRLFNICLNSDKTFSSKIYDDAFTAAKNWLANTSLPLKIEIFKFFNSLINKKYEVAYPDIISTIKENLFQLPSMAANHALNCLKSLLVNQNQLTINTVNELIESNKDSSKTTLSFELKQLLIVKSDTNKEQTLPNTQQDPLISKLNDLKKNTQKIQRSLKNISSQIIQLSARFN